MGNRQDIPIWQKQISHLKKLQDTRALGSTDFENS